MLYLILVIIVILFAIYFPSYKRTWGEVDPFVREVATDMNVYSGLSPSHYNNFVSKLQIVSETLDPEMLYSAIEDLDVLTEYFPAGDTHGITHIKQTTIDIGVHYEKMIMDKALQNGKPFMPKYLSM